MPTMEREPLLPGVDFVAPAECINSCPYKNDAIETAVATIAFESGNMAFLDVNQGITSCGEDGEKKAPKVDVICRSRQKYWLFGKRVCHGFSVISRSED